MLLDSIYGLWLLLFFHLLFTIIAEKTLERCFLGVVFSFAMQWFCRIYYNVLIYIFIHLQGYFKVQSNIRMENLQKLLTAIAVGYFCKGFVWNAWLNSECVWNLFLFSYLSVIHVLLYLFIHLLFHLLTSIYCICILAITPMC